MHNAWMEKPGDRLRKAREWARYESAAKAAEAMGISTPTYQGHENNSRGLGRNATRYANFFGVSLTWLLTGRGDPRGGAPIQKLFDELPRADQQQAIEYLEFLRSRQR
jgi:transcriptional regulator with XRE-family HTH domain